MRTTCRAAVTACAFALSAFALSAQGFFTEQLIAKPGIKEKLSNHFEQRFVATLTIGQEGGQSKLPIRGMTFDLLDKHAAADHTLLPGVNGPHPHLSSGARQLDIVQEGSFTTIQGTQHVRALNACWELIWKDDTPAGALICGFEIPEEYKRNDAVLPSDRMYLSFPIWTKDGLEYGQSEKARVESLVAELISKKNKELEKMNETSNPLMKALHYRKAYEYTEKFGMQPVERLQRIPSNDEVIMLQDDLYLTTTGLAWQKELPKGRQLLLGTATINLANPPQ